MIHIGANKVHCFRTGIFNAVFLICLVLTPFLPYFAQAEEDSRYASLVIDADTGAVLHQENAGKTRYPASLTKMMTLYLTFQALERGTLAMNKKLQVSAHAASQKPSVIGLRPGQTIAVQDLVNAVIIKSANDASVVLAEGLSGSEWQFSMLMTRTAKSLGMKNTNFSNASGLPDNRQVTTAYDLARLAVALRRDYPAYYPMFARASFTYNGNTYYTHNRVTKNYRGADGLKTGYIRASGFNLVTSARRGSKSLVGVVMGGRSIKSRDTNMVKLLDQAFYKMASGADGGASVLNTSSVNSEGKNVKQAKGSLVNSKSGSNIVASAPQTPKPKNIIIVKNDAVSNTTNQLEAFSRDVVINDGNIPYPPFKRDIFSPGVKLAAYEGKETSYKANPIVSDNIRATRVRVNGKKVPIPTFKPGIQEKGIVNVSPRGSRQDGLKIATAQ